MPARCIRVVFCLAWVALAGTLSAAEEAADLRLRIAPNELLRYSWAIESSSLSSGKEKGRDFTLTVESGCSMNLLLRGIGAGPNKSENAPVSIRIQDLVYSDKRSIEESRTDLLVSRGRVKYVENGKVQVDSENDIGLDKLPVYQAHVKSIESGEMRAVLDPAGRQSDVQGDPAMLETLKSGGATGVFPILAGKSVQPGESWQDSFSMPKVGEFKLAKPALIRSRMTFSKWTEKDGRKLAQIEVSSAWDEVELKGENPAGMLVTINRVEGTGAGTCLFDPKTGRFVEGSVTSSVKYRIVGEFEGQTTGLDVSGKTHFTFSARP